MAHRRTEHYIILYYIALNPFFLFTSYCNLPLGMVFGPQSGFLPAYQALGRTLESRGIWDLEYFSLYLFFIRRSWSAVVE